MEEKICNIIIIVVLCFMVIYGNTRLIYECVSHNSYWVLLYYPFAYILTCIPGYMFKKDAFKYESVWFRIFARASLVILFGGIFTFA